MKDPAFLFYSSDFLTGTAFMSDEEVGQYIRLLCYQHQHGHLLPGQYRGICRGNPTALIEAKFKIDSDGNYYNQRLDVEILKRTSFSASQKAKADKRWKDAGAMPGQCLSSSSSFSSSIPLSSPSSIPKVKSAFAPPSIDEIKAYCQERGNSIDSEKFHSHYESNGWMVGRNRMKDWRAAVRTWERGEAGRGRFEKPKLTKELLVKQAEAIRGF